MMMGRWRDGSSLKRSLRVMAAQSKAGGEWTMRIISGSIVSSACQKDSMSVVSVVAKRRASRSSERIKAVVAVDDQRFAQGFTGSQEQSLPLSKAA